VAVDANAITIGEFMLLADTPPLVKAVGNSLLDNGSVLVRDIPMVSRQVLVANGVRWTGNLPTVNWVKINEEGSTVKASPAPYSEQAYLLRNYVDIDEVLLRTEGALVDPRATQTEAVLKSIAYTFNDVFINNTHGSDADAPVGLRARLDDVTTWGIPSDNKQDATTDFSSTITAVILGDFYEELDKLLWNVGAPNGDGVVLYHNDQFMRRFTNANRQIAGSGGFSQAVDQFGRNITMYKGATFRDIGYKKDQSTRIITSNETSTGADGSGSDDYTSIYAVRFGMDGMFGWQYSPIEVKHLGLQDNGVIDRTLIQWVGGLYQSHIRSIGRLYGIKLT
jgi:hypothetical protein